MLINRFSLALLVATSLIYAAPVELSTGKFKLSENQPDIVIKKMCDPETNKYWMESSDDKIKSRLDIERILRENEKEFHKIHGALSKELVKKLETKFSNDSIKVLISLKKPKLICLDKTKYSLGELRKNELNNLKIEKDELNIKRGLFKKYFGITFNSEESESYSSIISASKTQIEKMARDSLIASIEEYSTPKPTACGMYTGIDPTGMDDLRTVIRSAYNPNTMDPSYLGQNINSATIESGIHPTVLQCIQNSGHSIGVVETSNWEDGYAHHSNSTFECLAETATKAKLFHHIGSVDQSWIINNNINTVSESRENWGTATTYYNRIVDQFAYRSPYTTFCNPTANKGHCYESDWQCYNAISVGNVRHTGESYYEILGTNDPCSDGVYGISAESQTKNPTMISGHPVPFTIDCYNLGGCGSTYRYSSDREMPHIVTPGYAPFGCGMMTECLYPVWKYGLVSGTSISAPITNGIAACVQSANSTAKLWPELTRAIVILSGHNVHGGYWSTTLDGIDGSGVISGVDAVNFARTAQIVSSSNNPVQNGYSTGTIPQNTGSSYTIPFNIQIPQSLPSGKHLRVLLTWDSSPGINTDVNELADLDLNIPGYPSGSWESNVEMYDLLQSQVTPGSTLPFNIIVWPFTIPADAYNKSMNSIYYAVAWTWIKDSAN